MPLQPKAVKAPFQYIIFSKKVNLRDFSSDLITFDLPLSLDMDDDYSSYARDEEFNGVPASEREEIVSSWEVRECVVTVWTAAS